MSTIAVTFLGTSSGGGPSESRNCSSLVCDMLKDGSLWMVDCAEGTNRQFQFQPYGQPFVKAMKVNKIFITHMHADHIMGIVPLLRNVLFPPPAGKKPPTSTDRKPPRIEIYGPAGIRTFVRQILKMTLTYTADTYTVHELLTDEDPVTPCDVPEDPTDPRSGLDVAAQNVMHVCEVAGRDIMASDDGLWRNVTTGKGFFGNVRVDAGPIHHRDPCLGFVFTETTSPNRKLVFLGDTYDPSHILPLCLDPAPSLLVHEATDAHIPRHADPTGKASKRTQAEVREKALARGHSVPTMAGAFAKRTATERLVLNHIGSRFPAPKSPRDARASIMREIEKQATNAWGRPGGQAIAAYDFLRVTIPAPPRNPLNALSDVAMDFDEFQRSVDLEGVEGEEVTAVSEWVSTSSEAGTSSGHRETVQVSHGNPSEGLIYVQSSKDAKKRRRP